MDKESVCEVGQNGSDAVDTPPAGGGDKAAKIKKIKKILLITLCVIIGVIVLGVIVFAPIVAKGNKVIVPDEQTPVYALKNWTSYLSDDTPITSMAIPGSHDSGCYDGMGYLGRTQNLTFAEQLARGVRYFDISVNASGKGAVIYHGPLNGVAYSDVLEDIAEFMATHPDEFLILDFQHFKNDSEALVFDMLEEYVGAENFVVNDTHMRDVGFIDSLTLGDVRGKCIVYIGCEETDYDEDEYLFYRGKETEKYPELSLVSYYERSKNGATAKKFAEEHLPSYVEQFAEEVGQGFFVLQAQMTDTIGFFGPSYREGRAIGYINDFVRGLYDSEYLDTVNIIMRDFVTCEKSALTLRLNVAKGYVDGGKLAEFEQMLAMYV